MSYCRQTLLDNALSSSGFLGRCTERGVGVMSAAPVAMGLLAPIEPPDWHPASAQVKRACAAARRTCEHAGVNIAELAVSYALREGGVCTTFTSMTSEEQVRANSQRASTDLTGSERELVAELRARHFRALGGDSAGPSGAGQPYVAPAAASWEGAETGKYWEEVGKALMMRVRYGATV